MSDAHIITPHAAASALVDALGALRRAESAVSAALSHLRGEMPAPETRVWQGVRTTGAQILAVLESAGGPMTLRQITHSIVALRQDVDQPRPGGGTRYGEMCREALARLIGRGLVRRIGPQGKSKFMTFELVSKPAA